MNSMNPSVSRGAGLVDVFDAVTRTLGSFPPSLVSLGLRVGVSAVFFKSGLTKLSNWDLTVQLFAEEYAVPLLPPEVAAGMGTAAELICPVLLVLGLGARFGALALLGMTAVIQLFVYPSNWPEHLLWASVFVHVLMHGAGAWSVDHLLARVFGRAQR